jgi:hypothetical protein
VQVRCRQTAVRYSHSAKPTKIGREARLTPTPLSLLQAGIGAYAAETPAVRVPGAAGYGGGAAAGYNGGAVATANPKFNTQAGGDPPPPISLLQIFILPASVSGLFYDQIR